MTRIITVDKCESTNHLLRSMASEEWMPGGTALRAVTQTNGRGQRGNHWEAEPGMNLTFSMILRPGAIDAPHHFLLSEAIAVAVARFLITEGLDNGHDIKIKWPNDILVDGKKIAGILIENSLASNGDILSTIAGVGINVNQTMFISGAPNATSMSAVTGIYYDLDMLMKRVADFINMYVDRLAPALLLKLRDINSAMDIEEDYHDMLWRNDGCFHDWMDTVNDETFTARITRVEPTGHLSLTDNHGKKRRYMFKEVFPA